MDVKMEYVISILKCSSELVTIKHKGNFTKEYYHYKNYQIVLTFTKISRELDSITVSKIKEIKA